MKASLRCWFRDVTALARSLTSSDGWFSRRASSGPASRPTLRAGRSKRVQEHKKEFLRERTAHWRVVLNSPIWPCPQAADRIRVSVWGGAPPMSRLSGVEFK